MAARYHKVTTGKARVGCDGDSALKEVTKADIAVSPNQRHYDLISGIRRLLREAPISIELFHVKGHQDDDPTAVLDRFALMNVEMDTAAKAHWFRHHDDDDF